MNALVNFPTIEHRSRELDLSFLRRVREASLHQLRLMRQAHLRLGCVPVFGEFACWRCAAISRQEGRR